MSGGVERSGLSVTLGIEVAADDLQPALGRENVRQGTRTAARLEDWARKRYGGLGEAVDQAAREVGRRRVEVGRSALEIGGVVELVHPTGSSRLEQGQEGSGSRTEEGWRQCAARFP